MANVLALGTPSRTSWAHTGSGAVNIGPIYTRTQNPASEYMNNVRDEGAAYKAANGRSRGYNTKAGLDFHMDSSDIVGLLCLQPAKSGGLSRIASSVAVFNELLEPGSVSALTGSLHSVNVFAAAAVLALGATGSAYAADIVHDAGMIPIAANAAMAAKMLRMVNSVYYGMPEPVNDLEQAIVILGFKTIRSIALSI